jgi:LysM repeat protein
MSDADFSMDWNKMYSNRNLATPASTNGIFLDGTIKYQCLTGYIFRKKESYQTDFYKEYIIVPEMGIVNKRSVPFEGAATKPFRLEKVGEIPFIEFIADKCKNADFGDSDANVLVTQYDIELTAKGGEAIPTSYANSPCGPPTRSGTHIVQKGETLYGISKKYGITVAQLKAWNNIGTNNLISVCQELVVKQISETGVGGSGANGGASTTNPTDIAPTGSTVQQTQFHIVKPNESVAQLAAMYGYTEDRFRKMNSLGAYERVYAGQKLFTSDCNCPNMEGVAADVPMPYDLVETERLTSQGNPDVYFRPIKVHKVQDNETLFSIALLYDTTVDRISELNGIDKNAKLNKDQRIYVQ